MIPALTLWLGLVGCGSEPEIPTEKPSRVARRAAAAEAPPRAEAPEGLPNVLVIVWDTVRADHTSLYGYDRPTTPRLEAWAQGGVVYERAVSPGVWTLPSHASLFTGLQVQTHGVNADHKRLEEEFHTFAEAYHHVGYDTYAFVANPYIMGSSRLLAGFDAKQRPWHPRWRAQAKHHLDAKLLPEDASTPVSPKWPLKTLENKYVYKEAGPLAAEALFTWIDEREEGERPWFAFLNYMEAHLPRVPSMDARQEVMTPDEIARAWNVPQTTETFHEWMAGVRTFDPLDLAAISGVYDASLVDLDAATGALFDELERRGLADDTLVILTSDHGELLGEHELLLHKYGVWNALSRVPLVMRWDGHLEPGRVAEPTSVADALVRATELTEAPLPQEFLDALAARPERELDGAVVEYGAIAEMSLRKLLSEHPALDLSKFERTWRALEVGPHKLVAGEGLPIELYDVTADPTEEHDLADAQPERAAELAAALEAWRAAVPRWERGEGTAPEAEIDEELREGLEALGYLE